MYWPSKKSPRFLVLTLKKITIKRFSANGQPYQLLHCDYLGGKGVGLARLHTPAGAVDLYISHLHADYSSETTSPASGTTDRQAW